MMRVLFHKNCILTQISLLWYNQNMTADFKNFQKILGCLKSGKDYEKSPPQGPPEEYPSMPNEAETLRSLALTDHGEDSKESRGKIYSKIAFPKNEEARPVAVELPTTQDLADIHVCGIDGSNQRVSRNAFEFILTRACMIVFRYSGTGEKPYFYRKMKDASAMVWVDGNIFDSTIDSQTEKFSFEENEKKTDILDKVEDYKERPFIVRYNRGEMKNNPSSYALGLAVKIQQALELLCIKETPVDKASKIVCIKDGPLFSTSVSTKDNLNGLKPILKWNKNQSFIACSKRVSESSLLLEVLLNEKIGKFLRKAWFEEQGISDDALKNALKGLASDANILPRVLKPGCRTPLFIAVPVARKEIVEQDKGLTPVSCYYRSRCRPYNYIRMELPLSKWEESTESANQAIKIAAWQHELGHSAPLVQLEADNQCDLSAERRILELQTDSALSQNGLNLLETYDG